MLYNELYNEYISQFSDSGVNIGVVLPAYSTNVDSSNFYTNGVTDQSRLTITGDINTEIQSNEQNMETNEILEAVVEEYLNAVQEVDNVDETPVEPLIPENSNTILIDEYTSRFNGAIWYDKIKELSVILGGAGGISSYVGFLLSRLKISRLIVYDPDTVEAVNISGQFYPTSSIGQSKVLALNNLLRDFSNFYSSSMRPELYTPESPSTSIMICGFDNMAARSVFFHNWLNHVNSGITPPEECLFIDGRLAAEEFQVLSIQGNDKRAIEEYQNKWLFSDAEAEATVCSYKQTTFMANMIASVMVNVFVNFAANQSNPAPIIPRDIPFFISYSADTMFTKIEM